MGLESTINTIADLNVTWPTDGDVASQGDNHLRLIKDAVKKTFPNISAVVTPDATELNTLDGINTANNFGYVPSKGVIMWSGSVASIPAGWFLCNGLNGTPNLIDRFVVGAGSAYAVGAMGGADTVTLTTAQIPSHSHTVNINSGGHSSDHSHQGYTGGTSGLTGSIYGISEGFWAQGTADGVFQKLSWSNVFSPTNGDQSQGGRAYFNGDSHTHGVQTYGSSNDHTHNVNGTSGLTGSGSAHENRPPYYALAYIMKS